MKYKKQNLKPTFKDWWLGKTYLETSAVENYKGVYSGIKTKIDDYKHKDQRLIKNKQKAIFENKCKTICKTYVKEFKNRYKSSEAKELLLDSEYIDLHHLFYTQTKSGISFRNRDFIISQNDLIIYRDIFENHIVRGKKYYGFVHSPKYKFPMKTIEEQYEFIYSNWLYLKWISKFKTSNNISEKTGKKNSKRFPIPVIALIYFYEKIRILRNNGTRYIYKYGYHNITSGYKLYNEYCWFSKKINRLEVDKRYNPKIGKKLKYLEMTAKVINEKYRPSVLKDIETYKKNIKKVVD